MVDAKPHFKETLTIYVFLNGAGWLVIPLRALNLLNMVDGNGNNG